MGRDRLLMWCVVQFNDKQINKVYYKYFDMI